MTNKLLKKYAIDVFFLTILLFLIISIIESYDIVDVVYLFCVVYYYVRIRLCKLQKCQ